MRAMLPMCEWAIVLFCYRQPMLHDDYLGVCTRQAIRYQVRNMSVQHSTFGPAIVQPACSQTSIGQAGEQPVMGGFEMRLPRGNGGSPWTGLAGVNPVCPGPRRRRRRPWYHVDRLLLFFILCHPGTWSCSRDGPCGWLETSNRKLGATSGICNMGAEEGAVCGLERAAAVKAMDADAARFGIV